MQLISILLAVVLLIAACGGSKLNGDTSIKSDVSVSDDVEPKVETGTSTPLPSEAPPPMPTPLPTANPTPTSAPVVDAEDIAWIEKREGMILNLIQSRGIVDSPVIAAMRIVPRHLFVPERYRDRAYNNTPLPIGEGQTISQPYIVALMSQLLDVEAGEKILEIGTGSGYQAAILAEMGAEVYSVEIIPVLGEEVRQRLDLLGYEQIQTRVGDGYFGWDEHGPFDGIIVTAAADHIPPPLLDQLKLTGKMVIPVGPPGGVQTLWLVEWREDRWVSINQGGVRFVPFLRE